VVRRFANMIARTAWLSPAESTLDSMTRAARGARNDGIEHLELMLQSSELMPGGSPSFPRSIDIERLYVSLRTLSRYFRVVRRHELREFLERMRGRLRPTLAVA